MTLKKFLNNLISYGFSCKIYYIAVFLLYYVIVNKNKNIILDVLLKMF